MDVSGKNGGSSARLIARIVEGSGLSQAELARRAGVPRSVVNAYLRGRREPGADALIRLAAAGGVDLEAAKPQPPGDAERRGRTLVQVLELAEALPFRPRSEMSFPPLAERFKAA